MSFLRRRPAWQSGSRKKLSPFILVGGCLIVAVSVWFFVRHVDGHLLLRALALTRPVGLAVACLLALAQLACRGTVFRTLIMPVVWMPWMRAQRFMLATSATTALVPGRAGDFVRAYLLKRDENVAVASTAAVTAVEKTVEVLAMFLVMLPVPLLLPHLPSWVGKSLVLTAVIASGLLLAIAILATRTRPPRWFASFSVGLEILRRPALLGRALLAPIGSWLMDLACLLAVMHAVGVDAPAASGLLVILAVNLAIAIPAVPGNLGTVELGAVAGLQPFGVSVELGLAVGILYHLAQVLPIAALALLDRVFAVEK